MHELTIKGEAAKAALPADRALDTGVDVIDKTSVAAFRAKLAELKSS